MSHQVSASTIPKLLQQSGYHRHVNRNTKDGSVRPDPVLAAQLLACWPGAQPSSSAQAHAGEAHVTDSRCRIAQNGSHARAARIVGAVVRPQKLLM